jgi:hypothetical protein
MLKIASKKKSAQAEKYSRLKREPAFLVHKHDCSGADEKNETG